MNARLLFVLALVASCAVFARAEEEESSLEGVETVEPSFIEETADGYPFQLPKKLAKTTVEPRYYGESNVKPKKYVAPEYQDPKPVDPKKAAKKNQPVVFTSHYFSPLPKTQGGLKLKASKDKTGRSAVPFRATVQTPTGLAMSQKGFTEAELFDGRLPNKYDDPRDNMKKTRAPAPALSFVEVDTTEEAEADAAAAPVAPPFSQADIQGAHAAVIVSDPQNFFEAGYQAPTWADEASEDEVAAIEAGAHVEVEDAVEQYSDLEAFLDEAEKATASFVEIDEEEEEEAEEADEEEAEEEEESEDEEAEEEQEPVALVETSSDAEEAELDELEVNERAAAQIDMDATSDEEGLAETDSDEESSDAEADADEEEVQEDEALEEAENAHAAALVEQDAVEGVDTLLAEVDSHLSTDNEKGTPGNAVEAGQTWEEAQQERLNQLEQQLQSEKTSSHKVQAQVVASKADLNAVDEEHQAPEYDSEAEQVETVEPEILAETKAAAKDAQTVLLEKIAQLKARRV